MSYLVKGEEPDTLSRVRRLDFHRLVRDWIYLLRRKIGYPFYSELGWGGGHPSQGERQDWPTLGTQQWSPAPAVTTPGLMARERQVCPWKVLRKRHVDSSVCVCMYALVSFPEVYYISFLIARGIKGAGETTRRQGDKEITSVWGDVKGSETESWPSAWLSRHIACGRQGRGGFVTPTTEALLSIFSNFISVSHGKDRLPEIF